MHPGRRARDCFIDPAISVMLSADVLVATIAPAGAMPVDLGKQRQLQIDASRVPLR